MADMQAQPYLQTSYAQHGKQRGNHARRAPGNEGVGRRDSIRRILPQIVRQL